MSMLLRRHYENNSNSKPQGVTKEVAPSPSSKKEKPVAENKELEITASDINKMTGPKLRKLAKLNGIADPEELTVNELKAVLREKYS